jgi:hypothetical protein
MLAKFQEAHEAAEGHGNAELPQQQVAQDNGSPQAGGCC